MYKKITLKNGLRIITVPMKNTQTATVLVLVGAGSKYENKENNGISHFLEHMFFKGTKKRPNTLKIAETLDKVGGVFNAFTGKEYTGYWAKVDSQHLDLAMDWVSDMFLNSKIEEKEIKKEKGVIIEELNMILDTPMSYIGDLWEKLLYGNQPAGWFIIGEEKNILKFKRKHFLNYQKNHYSAHNTIICVAGNINPKNVEKKIKKYFKSIGAIIPKSKLKTIEKQNQPQFLIHFKKTDQTHLCLGVRGCDLFASQKYAQAVLAAILGGYMSSRLHISVRERQGLAYYIHTYSENTTDTGYLMTLAGINNQSVEKAIKLILKEYKDLKNRKINQEELQKAKDYLKGTMTLSLEPSDAQASFYASQELLSQKTLTLKEKCAKIDKITREDILNTAQDIFQPEKLNLALIGPFRDKNKFQKLLKL
ncbi:insulinase family protein [Candidatus Parcubacteria bacterium]|nr:insulinase family protein [Candidatus Parcubacteria bacterium]